jgi:integrase
MRIYRRKAKSVWYIDPRPYGQRRSLKTSSKKVAQVILKDLEVKVAKGEFLGVQEPKKMVFDKLCGEYLHFSKANKTAQSHRRDEVSIRNLLKTFKGMHISKITAHKVERYMMMRKDEVKPATVNRELSCMKNMFTKAIQWDILGNNPLRSVKKFKEPPGRVRYLTDIEIERLLYCCPKHLKPIIITAFNTGMRKGEILQLQWQDVDMINRVITVKSSKNHESRNIPINDRLYATLLKLPNSPQSDTYVFLGKYGKPIHSFQNAWERALKHTKINDFRFHDLRHTFASHLAIQGVRIRTIQELLGQKTILMTMRYSHLSNKALREAVDKLASTGYNETDFGTNLAHLKLSKR